MKGRKPRLIAATKTLAAPKPPPELTEDALAEWNRVSGELSGRGLLTVLDRAALAAYCHAYGQWAAASRSMAQMAAADPVTGALLIKTTNGNAIQNPLLSIVNQARDAMVRFGSEFGMTPSARSRVGAAAEPKLGKKQIAEEGARTAGVGTDWGDDLTPPTASLN